MNIILGITGSVSAYKAPWLVRDLRRAGADVRVVMTPSATKFVAPLALEATSLHEVVVDPYAHDIQDGGSWHVQLAQWADAMLIAPCSATTLSRLASGNAETSVMTVAMSLPKSTPLVIAPAMDTDMWKYAATRRNLETLRGDGIYVIEPESGELASGLIGQGRLPEIDTIVNVIKTHWVDAQDVTATTHQSIQGQGLAGKHVVITAGPTHEYIDSVRYIANASSGKMGFAIARAAQQAGALVTLVAGPVHLPTPAGVHRVDVVSASQMHDAVMRHNADVYIMSAAVADYTPASPKDHKIKKQDAGEGLMVDLTRTVDILGTIGTMHADRTKPRPIVVGFALETANVIEYAKQKLVSKHADMIIANKAGGTRSGFGVDDNTITILTNENLPVDYPPMSKDACAIVIVDAIRGLIT